MKTPVKYPAHSDFRAALNRRVEAYFAETGNRPSGGRRLWTKTAVLGVWTAASYLWLVFLAASWWQVGLAATALALAIAGIGFNVQHDGGHGSFSSRRWGNRLTAWSLDLIGGSSYVWHFKHNILHHHYTNVHRVDDDLHAEPFLRMAPSQKRRWYHRFQHYYVWPLYGFLPLKWQLVDDFSHLATGRIGGQRFPRPTGWSLLGLFLGKAAFWSWTLVLPLFLHSATVVIGVYLYVFVIVGVVLGVVFQMAHCVEEASFQEHPADGERLPLPWAEHQLATTVNFSPRNRFLSWYLGGLNFQVEHHLFPRVSHVHYPRLSRVVQSVCSEYGIRHNSHRTLWLALRSHARHMRRLGLPEKRAA